MFGMLKYLKRFSFNYVANILVKQRAATACRCKERVSDN